MVTCMIWNLSKGKTFVFLPICNQINACGGNIEFFLTDNQSIETAHITKTLLTVNKLLHTTNKTWFILSYLQQYGWPSKSPPGSGKNGEWGRGEVMSDKDQWMISNWKKKHYILRSTISKISKYSLSSSVVASLKI